MAAPPALHLVSLLVAVVLIAAPPPAAAGRQLPRRTATAKSLSADGGRARAASDAAGNATPTVALGDGATATVERHSPTWEDAPICPFAPTSSNSVKDHSGRLWGWHAASSCAFRAPVAAAHDAWSSAPPCPHHLSKDKAVRDTSGRLWGWANNASCAWKDEARQQQHARRRLRADAPNAASNPVPTVRSVIPDAAVPVVLVNSVDTTPPPAVGDAALPASNGITTTTYGSGPDAVNCNLVTTTDPGSNTTRSQLKCEKVGDTSGAAVPSANLSPASPAGNTAAPVNAAAPSSPAAPAGPSAFTSTSPVAATSQPAEPPADLPPPAPQAADDPSLPLTPPPAAVDATSTAEHTTVNRFGSTWDAAPACVAEPTKRTSVQDTLGRLWWWEAGRSCAYRAPSGDALFYAGYTQVKWETAATCREAVTPTLINSMADAEGRLWSWEEEDNCVFRDATGGPVTHQQLLAAVSSPAPASTDG